MVVAVRVVHPVAVPVVPALHFSTVSVLTPATKLVAVAVAVAAEPV
jgi:hypothetical protein